MALAFDEGDFIRILTEPENALTRQYEALLGTEGLTIEFTSSGIEAIAKTAFEVNERQQNIGARRLHTVMERLLDELSFQAPDMSGATVTIDDTFVTQGLNDVLEDPELERYIL